MLLAKVVGTVVATRKEPSLDGLKLLLVRAGRRGRQGDRRAPWSPPTPSAPGPDEVVLIAAGSSARQTAVTDKRPVDAVVMAIVDSWAVDGADEVQEVRRDR